MAADPVDGAQTSGDVLFPHVGNGGYDVKHYDLDLAWTPGVNTLTGVTTIRATTTGAPLRSFSLDFENPTMPVSSVTVDGLPATFTKEDDTLAVKHKLVITPATPVVGTFTTVVSYSGVPVSHRDADNSFEGWNLTDDGVAFLNQPIGSMTGFPNNNTPADKATYDISVDIPTTLAGGPAAAASNGELAGREVAGDRTTWNWEQVEPMASELAMISIGRYDVLQSDVTLASGRTLHEWSFVDPAIADRSGIDAQRARWKEVLDDLEGLFGPYPGNSIGVVVDRASTINYALETQDRPFFPGGLGREVFEHELTHQWYGDAVAPRVWNDIWINEGMATWAPVQIDGESTRRTFFEEWSSEPADSDVWTIPPARMTDSADLYGYQTYSRGAQMWEALRLTIGDRAFFTFVREWQRRYGGQSHGRADFTALAQEISGRNLGGFFRDWLLDADKPAWPITGAPTPRLRGTQRVGRLLTVDPGTWSGSVSVRWLRAGRPIPGATHRRYRLVAADLGRRLVARVTYGRVGRAAVSKDVRTGAIRRGAMFRRPTPTVSGRPRVGALLTAHPGTHDPGTTVRYRWLADGAVVRGATGRTFRIPRRLRGDRVRVRTIASKRAYVTVVRTSAPTQRVI